MKRFCFILLAIFILLFASFFVSKSIFYQPDPLISIVISGQNMASQVTKSIEAIRNQTFSNWELIIIDDASLDDTFNVVSNYAQKDKRISLFRNKSFKGKGYNFAKAFIKAKGKYVSFWAPEHGINNLKLEKQILFMEKNNLDLAADHAIPLNHENMNFYYKKGISILKMQFFFQNAFQHSNVIARKSFLLQNALNFDHQYLVIPEYDLWLKIILKNGKIGIMDVDYIDLSIFPDDQDLKLKNEINKIRINALKEAGFDNSENISNMSLFDFFNNLNTINNTNHFVDPDIFNKYALSEVMPFLEFIHPQWKDRLTFVTGDTYRRANAQDTARVQFVPNGIILNWKNWPREYYECHKNVCSFEPYPNETELHVFLEAYATNPALIQMIYYVQLPQNTPKIIAWHRFPNLSQKVDLSLNNTIEVPLIQREGYWTDATNRVLKVTKKEMDKNPNLKLVLHANMGKYDTVLSPFLKQIPKERIRHIHLYEDGAGEIFKWNFEIPSKEEAEKILNGEQKSKQGVIFQLHHFFPTTIHLFGWKDAQKLSQYTNKIKNLKQADIRDVDFNYYRDLLKEDQKNLLWQLLGFDYNYWSNLLKGKKSVIFTMGFYFNNKNMENAEVNFLRRLMTDRSFSGINPAEYIWLYKPHPSFDAGATVSQVKEEFPNMVGIPAQIPFETFILAGLKPTKTTGYSSSLFYVLNESDILYFIRRFKGDGYLAFLKDVRHLPDYKILDLHNFTQE